MRTIQYKTENPTKCESDQTLRKRCHLLTGLPLTSILNFVRFSTGLVFFYLARLQWSHCKPPFNGYLCSVHRNLAQSNKALITCALSLRASSFFRLVSSSSRFLSSSSRFLLSCEMKINKINFDCFIYTSAISISIFTLR